MTRRPSYEAYRLRRPRHLEQVTVDYPEIEALPEGSVLVRVEAGGICGSDLPYYTGAVPFTQEPGGPPPSVGVPMHEIVGTVAACGTIGDLEVGMRVVGWADGFDGLAEVVAARAAGLLEIGGALAGRHAVALQPLACVLNAVDRLGDVGRARVCILGCGPIGVLFAHVLRSRAVASIVGVDVVDRGGAEIGFGFDDVVVLSSGQWARACTDDPSLRSDLVIEAIGHQGDTLAHAIAATATHGRVFYFGIPDAPDCGFPIEAFVRRNATLMAGYTEPAAQRASLAAAVAYADAHCDLLGRYVTDAVPFRLAAQAYERACHPRPGQLKVVVDFRVEDASG